DRRRMPVRGAGRERLQSPRIRPVLPAGHARHHPSARRRDGRLVTSPRLRQSTGRQTLANLVSHLDWSFAATPMPASERSPGLARHVLVGREQGAVHTELAATSFAPGGWLRPHVHSFEEGLYVLQGALVIQIGGDVHRLVAGDYCLMPIGTWHALANGGEG